MNSFNESRIEKLTLRDGVVSKLHIWDAKDPVAVVLAIHGGMAFGADYVELGSALSQQGISVIAPDLRGHVQKKVHFNRYKDVIEDIVEYENYVSNNYDVPIFYVGHSMGGLFGTIYGLQHPNSSVKGYIFSSPYYENKVKTAPLLVMLSGILSTIVPKMTAPIEDFTGTLTHDHEINERIPKDIEMGLRAKHASIRFARELLNAQSWLRKNGQRWSYPSLFLIAGDDHLADKDATINFVEKLSGDISHHIYESNYHENFNEKNRSEIFNLVVEWIKERS